MTVVDGGITINVKAIAYWVATTILSRPNWRLIAYWFFTVLVAYENLEGFI